MGGSSKQVTGYRYFANFLLFIGNPIENLLGINFDKRGWIYGKRIPHGDNGQTIYIESPSLYGENEGGVFGRIRLKIGADNQTVDDKYDEYMKSIGLQASAYPYQSYLSFSGSGKVNTGNGWIDGVFGALAGYMNDAFYLGNSGYMKEMLLWVKRIHVRNDGRVQWYDEKAGIGTYYDNSSLPSPVSFYDSIFTAAIKNVDGSTSRYEGVVKNSMHHNFGDVPAKDSGFSAELTFPVGGNVELIFGVLVDNIDVVVSAFRHSISYVNDAHWQIGNYVYNTIAIVRVWSPSGFKVTVSAKNNEIWSQRAVLGSKFTATEAPFGDDEDAQDINPIHKIREILTDDTAMNKPESDVNDINFMKAADRIYDEGLGISWSITEKSCLEAIEELCGHIEAGVRVNRQTGLYEMVLFRDDWFADEEIHTLAVNKIKSMSLEVANADEAINQLNVSYYNREAIKDSSFSIAENASIRNLQGRVNAEDANFPYFMNQRNAAVVAQWKLKQMSLPVWKGSFTTAEYNARKWNRYDLLKLAWPRKWQGAITVRIMKINLGTGTDVSIDFVEVVPYSSELSSNIVIDTPIDVSPLPPQPCQYEPFELPYYLVVMALGQRQTDDELAYENSYGLVGVVAEKPQNNSLYAVMMTHDGTEWLRAATVDYEATTDLDQTISKTSTSFTVKNSSALANIAVGTLVKCGNEWMAFQIIDLETGVVNVKRGALDSVPQSWQSGTKLYFCGNDVAYDQTEYISGEEVLVSALTATPSGMLEQKGSIAVEMNARAFRPYPPANVKINGEYWPEEIETDLVLTWVDRNRTQQTGGEILGWFDAGVTLESGVTYQLILTELDESQIELRTQHISLGTLNTFTFATSAMDANTRTIEVTLKTLRDGYECLRPFVHTVELSQFFSAPYDLTVEFKND